ncbi:uncharacterized protein LOC144123180 [Amblyomma americanum]
MSAVTAAICVLGLSFVTVSAETTVDLRTTSQDLSDLKSQYIADEAVLVGHFLRHVAYELQHDAELESETDEYFFRNLWNKTKVAFKKAGRKVKAAAKSAKPFIISALKEAGKSAAKAAIKVIRQRAQDKAIEIVSELFLKKMAGYAFKDMGSHIDVLNNLCTLMDQEGKRLIEHGEKLGAHSFIFSID